MEHQHGVHLHINDIMLDFDIIGIAVNPYKREEDLNKFYERHAATRKLPVYVSKAVAEGSVRLLLGKMFMDIDVEGVKNA